MVGTTAPSFNELIRQDIDMIVISSAAGALAAKKATTKMPIVFAAVTDPFEHGLIASLAQPGGNLTGTSLAVGEGFSGKWVEFLKESVPKVTSFAVLWNPTHPVAGVFAREAELAARGLGISLRFSEARDPKQLNSALAKIETERAAALLVIPDPVFSAKESSLRISQYDSGSRPHFCSGNLPKPGD